MKMLQIYQQDDLIARARHVRWETVRPATPEEIEVATHGYDGQFWLDADEKPYSSKTPRDRDDQLVRIRPDDVRG
jgi:hypothetical protein